MIFVVDDAAGHLYFSGLAGVEKRGWLSRVAGLLGKCEAHTLFM